MATPLFTCSSCGTHGRAGEACPHCGTVVVRAPTRTSAAALLGIVLLGCPDPNTDAVALYGVAIQDEDGDGYAPPEDCNDADAAINPGATELPDDGVDSDCDDQDNPVDSGG